ncbi:MAG TPA: sugar phosphate isomerase/epimerase [Solirubrobacteraceae bacterium]
MGDIELLALYWTVAGPADVHVGREWSTFEWRDRCAEAARVGFQGLGLWHADIEHQLETRSLAEMKEIFDAAGLRYLQVEFLADFFVAPEDPLRAESDQRRRLLFDTAAAFDAHHIKVGNIPGTPCELSRLTEAFGELCQDAADHTAATVVYEFMPFDVNVNTLESALEVVQGAAQANGGLAIDTWHMAKLGIEPDALREVPLEYLSWVELSDGMVQNMDDLIEETVNHRRLPGEGEFDLPAYVAVCQEIGYTQPWGVEVLSAELRSLPIDQEFQRAYETTIAQFRAEATVSNGSV